MLLQGEALLTGDCSVRVGCREMASLDLVCLRDLDFELALKASSTARWTERSSLRD